MSCKLVQRNPTGCICVCDLRSSTTESPRPELGPCDSEEKKDAYNYMYKFIKMYFKITYDKDADNKKEKFTEHPIG